MGHTGEMTMSWLSLNGYADTELDNTVGRVSILSSIRAGGQLSLHLHVLPVAHCKWLWGGQRASVLTQTMSAWRCLPLGVQFPGRPQQGWGEDSEGWPSQQLRELVVLESQGSCASSCHCTPALHPLCSGLTQVQTELCVSSLLQHSSSCLSRLKSPRQLCVTEVRKGAAGAAGAAPTWIRGGSLRPCTQISCTSCLGCTSRAGDAAEIGRAHV